MKSKEIKKQLNKDALAINSPDVLSNIKNADFNNYKGLPENIIVNTGKIDKPIKVATPKKGLRTFTWIASTAAALAVIITAAIVIPGLVIGKKIRPLEDYRAVVDGYFGSDTKSNAVSPSIAPTASAAQTIPTLDDYNFKIVTDNKYAWYDNHYVARTEPAEWETGIVVDGEKAEVTSSAPESYAGYYIDADRHYFKFEANGSWYYDEELDILSLVSYYNEFLNPDLYDKVEKRDVHIYTLKPNAIPPQLNLYKDFLEFYADFKVDISLKINAECFLLEITETTVYDSDSILVFEITQKIILDGQTVKLPADCSNAIKYKPEFTDIKTGDGTITLTWKAPEGLLVTGYEIYMDPAMKMLIGESEITRTTFQFEPTTLSYTFTGLTNGTEYTFRLIMSHTYGKGYGYGVPSEPVTATPGV